VQRYNAQTALIVVDVQNDFTDPNGSLYVMGGAAIVPRINGQVDEAINAGALVIYTQDWHPEHTPHFAQDGGIWPVHCVHDTWGAALHPALDVVDGAPIVRKGANGEDGYSGFTMRDPVTGETIPTGLEQQLRDRGVDEVVVAGLATDYCVRASALDAAALGFRTTLLEDAVAAVNLNPGDGERALKECDQAGVLLMSTRTR
jgi:nicotinamidase/pyrazinamidase